MRREDELKTSRVEVPVLVQTGAVMFLLGFSAYIRNPAMDTHAPFDATKTFAFLQVTLIESPLMDAGSTNLSLFSWQTITHVVADSGAQGFAALEESVKTLAMLC